MECLICGNSSEYFFSKKYTEPPFDEYMRDIGVVNYYRCSHCGFVLSRTHAELSLQAWAQLNNNFHHHIERADQPATINQPPYAEQALMLSMLDANGVISLSRALDYAAGYGTLSKLLRKYFGKELPIYDPYVQSNEMATYVSEPLKAGYETVMNSAMFEHVLTRAGLDAVRDLVSDTGNMIIHTVVCENIPKDPDWFYLRPPVHTAFHTNKSMNILMKQWGFKSSLYCPPSKCWVLCREDYEDLAPVVDAMNQEFKAKWFYAKPGFVDFWKGF